MMPDAWKRRLAHKSVAQESGTLPLLPSMMSKAFKTQADLDLEHFVSLPKRLEISIGVFSVLMMGLAFIMIYPTL